MPITAPTRNWRFSG